MNNIVLETKNLSKVFGSFWANQDVSIQLKQSSIHAVIGENGAGKSTLMKMLFGLYQPSQGQIYFQGRQVKWLSPLDAIQNGIGMVHQHFSLVEPLSVIDNIMIGTEKLKKVGSITTPVLDRKQAIAYIERNLPSPSLILPWFEKVSNLTVGEKQKVEILKLLYRDARILILDEPTAVLTPHEIQDLFQILHKLRNSGRSILLISHKLDEVFSICDEYTVLRTGRVAGHGLIASASRDEIIEMMMGRRVTSSSQQRSPERGETALDCQNLHEPSADQRGSLKKVNLRVQRGQILGIAGVEGAGQKHLVECILGLRPVNGKISLFGEDLAHRSTRERRELGIGLIPQDRKTEGLWGEESCFHNMIIGLERDFSNRASWIGGLLNESEIQTETTKWAQRFDVRASSLHAPAQSLSGGNQQKLIIARELEGRKPKFLICHQPTRGVDLGAVERIHQTLLNFRNQGLAILLISSDLDELMTLSDRIAVLFAGETFSEFDRSEFNALQIGKAMTGVRS